MSIIDSVVVGSGPAGYSAAIYIARAGYDVKVIEGDTPGGLLITTDVIDNYLGFQNIKGIDLANTFKNHVESIGEKVSFTTGVVKTITKRLDNVFEIVLKDNSVLLSRSVVWAAGSTPRKLGVVGEDLNGVSYCATCDGIFFSDENVVIIGGGDTALEDALYLSNITKKVTVIVRKNKFRGNEVLANKLSQVPNVEIMFEKEVSKINDDGSGNISSVTLNTGEELDVSGVFIAIGQDPNTKEVIDNVTLYDNGFIKKSNTVGFFVAGDVCDPDYRQVIIAAGDGAKTGINVSKFLVTS